jgi:WD40 repeat protein
MSKSISELCRSPLYVGAQTRFIRIPALLVFLLAFATSTQAKELLTLGVEEFAKGVEQLAFSPDSKTLAVACGDGISLWDVETGKMLKTTFDGVQGTFHGLAFSPDGKLLVGSNGASTWVLDVATGKNKHVFKTGQAADEVNRIAISPDGKILALSGMRHSATLLDLENYKELGRLEGQKEIVALAFDKTGETLATAALRGATVIWDVKKREQKKTVGTGFGTAAMAYSQDGKTVVTIEAGRGGFKCLIVWDVEKGKPRATYGGVKPKLGDITFSDAGNVALSPDGKTFLWRLGTIVGVLADIDSGEDPAAAEGFKMDLRIEAMALSPDGKLLAIGGQKGVMIGEAPKKKKE